MQSRKKDLVDILRSMVPHDSATKYCTHYPVPTALPGHFELPLKDFI